IASAYVRWKQPWRPRHVLAPCVLRGEADEELRQKTGRAPDREVRIIRVPDSGLPRYGVEPHRAARHTIVPRRQSTAWQLLGSAYNGKNHLDAVRDRRVRELSQSGPGPE